MEKYKLNIKDNFLEYFADCKYQSDIVVEMRHYVTEYCHTERDNENFNSQNINKHSWKIEDRDSYKVPEWVFAFQFYDLIKIHINGEVLEGKRKHNESPMIYVGRKYFLEKKDSSDDKSLVTIIDIDGVSHFDCDGITYEEYLGSIENKDISLKEIMKNCDLSEQLISNNKKIEDNLNEKLELELTPEVQKYLSLTCLIDKEKKYQEYLEKLEVGEGGFVFSPYEDFVDKSFRTTHFGLSVLLKYAFDLLIKETKEDLYCPQISFNSFYDYVKNAKQVLNEMKYVPGDRLFENEYGLKIYQNPKNYSIIDLDLLPQITNEQLLKSYNVSNICVSGDYFVRFNLNNTDHEENINKNLTPREKEAFYGEGAKRALGILPYKVKERSKK